MSYTPFIRRVAYVALFMQAGCSGSYVTAPSAPPIVTDAAQYVLVPGHNVYVTTITYEFRNTTGVGLSSTHCNTPPPPVLEKNVEGGWVVAYILTQEMCLTIPHFYIAPDAVFRHTFPIVAAFPGTGIGPEWKVESIPGTYRLRWGLWVGPNPAAPSASAIQPVSNEFQLVLE